MAGPVTRTTSPPRDGSRKPRARSSRRVSRSPAHKLLPAPVLDELMSVAQACTPITMQLVRELDSRLRIAEQYDVSHRRLKNLLVRLQEAAEPASGRAATSKPDGASGSWKNKLRAHRRRQASVASILDAAFGRLTDCNPDLWERRAYLMFVGLVYERLATSEGEIPTDELVALAKVLAEHRRVGARTRACERRDNGEDNGQDQALRPSGELPARLADVVRQVYGTNFHSPDAGGTSVEDDRQSQTGEADE